MSGLCKDENDYFSFEPNFSFPHVIWVGCEKEGCFTDSTFHDLKTNFFSSCLPFKSWTHHNQDSASFHSTERTLSLLPFTRSFVQLSALRTIFRFTYYVGLLTMTWDFKKEQHLCSPVFLFAHRNNMIMRMPSSLAYFVFLCMHTCVSTIFQNLIQFFSTNDAFSLCVMLNLKSGFFSWNL